MTHSGLCDLGSWKDADEPPTFAAKIYEYSNERNKQRKANIPDCPSLLGSAQCVRGVLPA